MTMIQKIKRKFRSVAPIQLYLLIGSVYWCLSPSKTSKIVIPDNECYRCYNLKIRERYFFPDLDHQRRASIGRRDKIKKYTLPGFVEINSSDTVVDVGAFVGEFSLPASKIGKKVISIEPAPRNYHSLEKNARNHNIQTIQAIVSDTNVSNTLNIGEDPSDHSIMDVDVGEIKSTVSVESVRLDELVEELDEDHIDFLKIDAEGAEPEVLRGASGITIRKVAVDCSPERNGETTVQEVTKVLEHQGFETQTGSSNKYIVFGVKK